MHASFCEAVGKAGNAPGECEDIIELFGDARKIALSDGATEASYAAVWARILTRAFAGFDLFHDDFEGEAERWFEDCQREWAEWERQVLEKPLQWFARAKLTHGASATFLGMALGPRRGEAIPFRAVACGDSCLFVVNRAPERKPRVRLTFPMSAADEFNTTPPLLSTSIQSPRMGEILRTCSGSLGEGDTIYMATDALAMWCLLQVEDGASSPWEALDRLETASDLEELVAAQVALGKFREDDVALVRIEYDAIDS